MLSNEFKYLKQQNSEVLSDGASVNDRDEDWDAASQLLPQKR